MMKEENIRPKEFAQMESDAAEADLAFLLSEKNSWEHVPCPACDADVPVPFGKKAEVTYVTCNNCETIYINPRPNEDLLHKYYGHSKQYEVWNNCIFPSSDANRREHIYLPRAKALITQCQKCGIPEGASFLEMGAGFGSFCDVIKGRKYFGAVNALEPTPLLAQHCQSLGLEVIHDFAENMSSGKRYDVVCAYEVIEHVSKPFTFVKDAFDALEDNGLFVLSCPNPRGFDLSVLGLKSDNFSHGHLNYFHPKSIALLLKRAGFSSIEVTTPGKLDVELVRKSFLKEGKLSENVLGRSFLHDLLIEKNEVVLTEFQTFLVANGMSSHMVVMAQKV